MRTRAAIAAAAAVAAGALTLPAGGAGAQEPCGGVLQPPCPSPTPTPPPTPGAPAGVHVTLVAVPEAVAYDGRRSGRVRLRGQLTGGGPVGGVRVRLTGHVPAYGRSVAPRTATTDDTGRFRFVLRPQVNTEFRAEVAGGQPVEGRSDAVRVRVFPVLDMDTRARGGDLRIDVSALGPRRLRFADGEPVRRLRPGTARRAHFYLRLGGERRFRRVGSDRLSAVTCGSTCRRRASFVVRRASLLRRSREVGVCVRGTVFRGFGARSPCGAARKRF